jgi:hypothetical protein
MPEEDVKKLVSSLILILPIVPTSGAEHKCIAYVP